MMLEFFPYPFIIGTCILVVVLGILRKRKFKPAYLFFFSIFWIYGLVLVGAILFPMPIGDIAGQGAGRQSAAYILSRVNLVPFNYSRMIKLARGFVIWREIVANILMTMPFGFGISFVARVRARQVPWLALALGFGIESVQLGACLLFGLSYRGVDISDALMNAIGVLCGYGCFLMFCWVVRKSKAQRRNFGPD